MLKFLTSLSFLYLFAIVLMAGYGLIYYRGFIKNGYQRRLFPWVFLLISAGCFSFLYFNIHPPRALKTFTNIDHHYIRHDGFKVDKQIELGRKDTLNYPEDPFNNFLLTRNKGKLTIAARYSEEPFYIFSGIMNRLASVTYPVAGHSISFQTDTATVQLLGESGNGFKLYINDSLCGQRALQIRKGLTAWNLFRDDTLFINSGWYADEKIARSLKHIMLLRDNFSKSEAGELKYFLSGRLFQSTRSVQYDKTPVEPGKLAFTAVITDKNLIGWGLGFPERNKNQFLVSHLGADSFQLACRYPVSYPLTEEPVLESNRDWTDHHVVKFLVADTKQIGELPAVFREGFLFAAFPGDSTASFAPFLMSYRMGRATAPLQLEVKSLNGRSAVAMTADNKLLLPAKSPGFSWQFSITNSANWNFGVYTLSAKTWQLLLFGSLFFFFVLVFFSAWLEPAGKLSWVWQVLSCVVILLLTVRFFLYWRYKTFPPYEGMDLPSVQQVSSIWNFGIIILATLILGIVFGAGLLRHFYQSAAGLISRFSNKPFNRQPGGKNLFGQDVLENAGKIPFVKRVGTRTIFWTTWIFILMAGAGLAAFSHFNPATCRHLAIALVLLYFVYTYLSLQFSPLVVATEKSWWRINTEKKTDIIISNPVKVLLSLSMLALFSFIDIGFALIFFNFLLFNEAFLLINYSIAGLSVGSRRNAALFGLLAVICLLLFAGNIVYGPYLFRFLFELPQQAYAAGYLFVAAIIAYACGRLLTITGSKKKLVQLVTVIVLFTTAFLFFPKERIQDKAARTKYRIDVLTMPSDRVIEKAYERGDSYEPVIRAAQNQWFINTFIDEDHNPSVNSVGFQLLPHAPQNRGAKYNAQATDLVASRFLIAEHGRWSVLFYVLLLLMPVALLASFYKLYPDFTNRINNGYAAITTGFMVLNYLLITALLVILAATGRYIFFGQDLPFGSILSKQSILFPSLLIIIAVLLFRNIPLQQYPNRKKLLPGFIVFSGLLLLLFFVQPGFNRDKDFGVTGIAKNMEGYIQTRLQPLLDDIDTSARSRRLPLAQKDRLFSYKLKEMMEAGLLHDASAFLQQQVIQYYGGGFAQHLDQNNMLFLDLNAGSPQLAVNENYFHVEAPPHLQQLWQGNIFGDTSTYTITLWNAGDGSVVNYRTGTYGNERSFNAAGGLEFAFREKMGENLYGQLCLVNRSGMALALHTSTGKTVLNNNDSLALHNPDRIYIRGNGKNKDRIVWVQPDAFMRNYYVNGSRFYHYPLGSDFIWARNFAESISSEYTGKEKKEKNVFIALDTELTDSLSLRIKGMMQADTAYKNGAEYAICIADGNGRLMAMPDFIKGFSRPDPNDKAAFSRVTRGEQGFIAQSQLRKKIGNINLLRLNPGPGSTLKPVIFSAIASQLNMDWDAFAAEGFSEKQEFFGGERVAAYDFEKDNGRITRVSDYLKYSDNYYHSNLLLLGSYSKQSLQALLLKNFISEKPGGAFHWPYFSYKGRQYWLNGFEHWPGYAAGKANFGSDSSFVSIGLFNNYGIHTYRNGKSFDRFDSPYDSALFGEAYRKSGFVLPEYALFDQKGTGMNLKRPNEVFMSSFRGHVKGSSQVMVPPVKMLDVFGKLVSQNRHYSLTLDPYAEEPGFSPFNVDNSVSQSRYLSLMKESVFNGMEKALFSGTAARLGTMLKNGSPYFYYAKTGTTGDDERKTKSKLFAIIISKKDIADPDYNFRNNRFIIIYFTSQNGPAKQNEEFQAQVIQCVRESSAFKRYMDKK